MWMGELTYILSLYCIEAPHHPEKWWQLTITGNMKNSLKITASFNNQQNNNNSIDIILNGSFYYVANF